MATPDNMNDRINLVMLVDDNDIDNFISQRTIELTNFANEVITKNSGKSALEYLEQHKDDESKLPDLIFLDINMPIVDGFIFLYEFGNMPESIRKKCRISVLSSSDNKKDIDRIVGNEYVIKFTTKPLTENSLAAVKEIWQKVSKEK